MSDLVDIIILLVIVVCVAYYINKRFFGFGAEKKYQKIVVDEIEKRFKKLLA